MTYSENEITVANQISQFIGRDIHTGKIVGPDITPYAIEPTLDEVFADETLQRKHEDEAEELREQKRVKKEMENGN